MRFSSLIWIPSLQTHKRFFDLNIQQYKNILKTVEETHNYNFCYITNEIIKENINDDLDFNILTILDKFIILLYLKINNVNETLRLSKECEKCKNIVETDTDLLEFVQVVGNNLDQNFQKNIFCPVSDDIGFEVVCDIPSCTYEYKFYKNCADLNVDILDIHANIDHRSYKFIKNMRLYTPEKTEIIYDVNDNAISSPKILDMLPACVRNTIEKEYIAAAAKNFSFLELVKFDCKKCGHQAPLLLNLESITFISKILFKDYDTLNLEKDFFNLSSVAHLNAAYLADLTPKEFGTHRLFLKNVSEKEVAAQSDNKNIDLFSRN